MGGADPEQSVAAPERAPGPRAPHAGRLSHSQTGLGRRSGREGGWILFGSPARSIGLRGHFGAQRGPLCCGAIPPAVVAGWRHEYSCSTAQALRCAPAQVSCTPVGPDTSPTSVHREWGVGTMLGNIFFSTAYETVVGLRSSRSLLFGWSGQARVSTVIIPFNQEKLLRRNAGPAGSPTVLTTPGNGQGGLRGVDPPDPDPGSEREPLVRCQGRLDPALESWTCRPFVFPGAGREASQGVMEGRRSSFNPNVNPTWMS